MLRITLLFALVASLSLTAEALAAPENTAPTIDRAELRTALVKQRALNLKRFHRYRLKRVYPHNTYEPGLKNVWTDADGNLCAVATLMKIDGKDDLVERTAKDTNFVRVAELTSGPLIDWVLTSGFTQEEIVMIQQPSAAEVWEMDREYRAQQRRLKRQRDREDDRLARNYRATESALKQAQMANAGLDLAVERLAQRPQLAALVLASSKTVATK